MSRLAMSTRRRERGSMTLEMVLLTPILVGFLGIVVVLGRITETGSEVTGAARDAARAASLQRTPTQAVAVAATTAADLLDAESIDCSTGASVAVDTSNWRPGGWVQVRVSCVVRLEDVAFRYFPGSRTVEATAVSPLELFRGVG
ncbi:MAG: pilus assembly protein [Sporichthyaceae bacterium]|nr:pilus assembly protein [Sporichthyaceae bacterium]